MTSTTSLKSVALIAVTATATSFLMQACGGDALAQSAADADPIEGVWDSTLTVKDCTSGAVLATFKGLGVLHRGGTMSSDNSQSTVTRGAAFGTWKRGTGNAYTSTMVFMRFNPDTTLAGTQKVLRSFTVSADGATITGTNTIQFIDTAGAVFRQGCANETGVRSN